MSTINDWNKYMNLLHELALVEKDLREVISGYATDVAECILYERFQR